MSRDWTPDELQAVSQAMRAAGHMGYEEFCQALEDGTIRVEVISSPGGQLKPGAEAEDK